MEIYSSGEGFHLELPTGDQEGPNDLWEIPPFQTKAIIRVQFEAKIVQNHTAYVRYIFHYITKSNFVYFFQFVKLHTETHKFIINIAFYFL